MAIAGPEELDDDLGEPELVDLVERATAALGLEAGANPARLKSSFRSILDNWIVDRLTQSVSGQPGEQRKLLQRLARSIAETISIMQGVAPEYAVAVSFDDLDETSLFVTAQNTLERLHERIRWFDETYRPKKGSANVGLDEGVRALLEVFQAEGLERPRVRQGRAGIAPDLVSAEAKAIGILLQGSVPDLETRTLVNKIAEVMKGQPPVEPHLYAIWAACDGDLDLAVFPPKKGPSN